MLNDLLNDVLVVEGEVKVSDEERAVSVQRLINAGNWKFQGSIGRTMMGFIESGLCMLGPSSHKDYWGNRVPSRDDIEPGCMGTKEYVAQRMGEEYADHIAIV